MKSKLTINFVTSKIFWGSIPLVINEISKREHYLYVFDDSNMPSIEVLLDCDVLLDLSAITDIKHYKNIQREYEKRKKAGKKTPLLVDSPSAVINSMDKRKTHKLMPELCPKSYDLDGVNNVEYINNFKDGEYVVIKDPFGWWAQGIDRLSPKEAIKKYKNSKDLIVQEYVPFSEGVGRLLTLMHGTDFEVMCAYLRKPNSWRTGSVKEGIEMEYVLVDVDQKLFNFGKKIAEKSGIYFNGIDYIYDTEKKKYILIEVNVAPGLRDPYDEFNIDTPKMLIDHIERNSS